MTPPGRVSPGGDSADRFTVMGIVNVTPDSFSDGGRYLQSDSAIAHALKLEAEGAGILDIGGQSTRPGAMPVAAGEEYRRVVPVVAGLREAGVGARLSAGALAAGATIVNDVTALRGDPELADVVAAAGAEVCLMHMQGEPRTMQADPRYGDVVDEVKAFLVGRIEFAVGRGIAEERILVDPGIGFGKTVAHNVELLRRLGEIVALGRPVVIGTSRKSFLGELTGRGIEGRLPATIASNVVALEHGARVFRVHDVAPLRDALAVAAATLRA
jgi:dihydropteroate synthase